LVLPATEAMTRHHDAAAVGLVARVQPRQPLALSRVQQAREHGMTMGVERTLEPGPVEAVPGRRGRMLPLLRHLPASVRLRRRVLRRNSLTPGCACSALTCFVAIAGDIPSCGPRPRDCRHGR